MYREFIITTSLKNVDVPLSINVPAKDHFWATSILPYLVMPDLGDTASHQQQRLKGYGGQGTVWPSERFHLRM